MSHEKPCDIDCLRSCSCICNTLSSSVARAQHLSSSGQDRSTNYATLDVSMVGKILNQAVDPQINVEKTHRVRRASLRTPSTTLVVASRDWNLPAEWIQKSTAKSILYTLTLYLSDHILGD